MCKFYWYGYCKLVFKSSFSELQCNQEISVLVSTKGNVLYLCLSDSFSLSPSLYMCVGRACVYILCGCIRMCMHVFGGQMSTSGVIFSYISLYFFRQGFSLNLELTDHARLADRWALGIRLSLGLQTWLPHLLFTYMVLRDLNSGSHAYLIVTISTKPSL